MSGVCKKPNENFTIARTFDAPGTRTLTLKAVDDATAHEVLMQNFVIENRVSKNI